MKKAFIITSAIEVNNDFPLTYSSKRSHFNTDERLRQTIVSVAALDLLGKTDTTIYLLDVSTNWSTFAELFRYQANLKFISVAEQFPEIHQQATTHPNKSYCESLIMSTFMRKFATELKEYDFVFKLSGRYFVDGSFDPSICNEQNLDKIFYKRPLEFQWRDEWNYHIVDRRKEQGTNTLRQYCSVLFGWGREHHNHFLDIFTGMTSMLNQPSMMHLDIETLGYFLTRPFADKIIETTWIVYGWDGASGKFWRY